MLARRVFEVFGWLAGYCAHTTARLISTLIKYASRHVFSEIVRFIRENYVCFFHDASVRLLKNEDDKKKHSTRHSKIERLYICIYNGSDYDLTVVESESIRNILSGSLTIGRLSVECTPL